MIPQKHSYTEFGLPVVQLQKIIHQNSPKLLESTLKASDQSLCTK